MHDAARSFVARHAGGFPFVVEYGGRDVNGGVRDLFTVDRWVSIDLTAGPGVDVVADARTWRPHRPADLIVCCEVAEHCPSPSMLVVNAYNSLRPGGLFLFTAACPPRAPHSAVDGGPVRDEHYGNIDPDALRGWLEPFEVVELETHSDRGDVYAAARRETGVLMSCSHGCCESPREHWGSVAVHARKAAPKVTTHHTDTAVVTETEPNIERCDVNVAVLEPVESPCPK